VTIDPQDGMAAYVLRECPSSSHGWLAPAAFQACRNGLGCSAVLRGFALRQKGASMGGD
jgi:hypothetical protein